MSLLGYILAIDTRDPRIGSVIDNYLAAWAELDIADAVREMAHDPRMAAFVRLDALTAALSTGADDAIAPFADWLPDLVRAAGSADPADAQGVRLA